MHKCSVEEILSTSWDRKIAYDLLAELEAYTGARRSDVNEVRTFLACKAQRELLERLQRARGDRRAQSAVRAVAQAMRDYASERPVLSAAAFLLPANDSPEWRDAHARLFQFIRDQFVECGLYRGDVEVALYTLQSLVRGFVLNEMFDPVLAAVRADPFSTAVEIFIAGTTILLSHEGAADPSSVQSTGKAAK
ncbi:TetR-like C-terminal domain-containing protein [Bradyrhizobium vignae]|uniref:TetR-like C-terminal domain-containing protein n=1 Tax=Bradyrhizobium vignae TaxID=1549949 RepID=UPI00100AF5C6|nr:TetR-like C-terminal domain-containing protein [Bradyrhizobium vignae]RXH02177.1 hypothetical protein EAV90_15820 [Bradyrhizobium vignae]